ncbi:MAG: hypothetical protein PHS66_05960 [Candidatus Omnitrophica bacterium]|nr:hypothetical protein [Candidatus Omnitrophota bacterium]
MIKNNILCIKLRVISISLCFVAGLLVSAAQADKLPYVSQSKIRILAGPGETVSGEITIENPTAESKNINLYLEDWHYLHGSSGAKEFVSPNSMPYSACPWISFTPRNIQVPPFGKQKVSYSVNIPAGAEGARYASLFFETMVSKGVPLLKSGSYAGFDINIRVATLFYVEVQGTVFRSGQLNNLKVEPSQAVGGGLDINLDFANTGNTDIATLGEFILKNKEGAVVARGVFNNLYAFQHGKGALSSTIKEMIPPGVYGLKITVDLGKATAEAGMGNGPVITKEAVVTIGENNRVIEFGELS